ncbi:MAG: ATP-binding cassette domain-containing protein, partial [bacterium]
MLQARNVCIYLNQDDRLLIDGFSFSLGPTDKVAIIGEEGNGKSTLLKLLYDDEAGHDYMYYTGEIIRQGKIAYLPQFMDEQACLSVSDYLAD